MLLYFSGVMAQEPPMKITDSGELLSTYHLENSTQEKDQIRAQVGEDLLQDILDYSNESSWPSGISTLDGRNKNRSLVNEYVAYKVATFGTNSQYYVLRIPTSKNGFQPSQMIPSRDIYFIIGKGGVTEMNGDPYVSNNQSNTNINSVDSDNNEGEEEEMREVRILNPMELYSTYDLRKDEVAKQLLIDSGELTEAEYDVLADMTNEKSWPSGINSYSNREGNRPKIKNYKAYMALEYESNGKKLIMLYIPKEENDFMPSDMQPNDELGFYMMFNREGVEYVNGGDDDAPVPIKNAGNQQTNSFTPSVSRTSAYTFNDQLNVLVEGLHNNFADLKGGEIKEDFLLGKKNEALVNLAGAEETYIYEAILSGDVDGASAIAVFEDYKDMNEAIKAYKTLAQKVADTRFPCCTLVQNEQEDETLRTTYWLPFDINGKMHPSMAKMVVEVQLMKTLGIDSNTFKTYDNYSLVLRIYKQK